MAAVISALWAGNDQSPMILPASVPLDDAAVQAELTRNLDQAWQPIIDSDIDGPASVPHKSRSRPIRTWAGTEQPAVQLVPCSWRQHPARAPRTAEWRSSG